MYVSDLWPNSYAAQIEVKNGNVETQVSYARLSRTDISAANLVYDHVHFEKGGNLNRYRQIANTGEWVFSYFSTIPIVASRLQDSRVTNWGRSFGARGGNNAMAFLVNDISSVMVNNSVFRLPVDCEYFPPTSISNSVFYANVVGSGRSIIEAVGEDNCSFTNNAVLNPWFELDLDKWLFLSVLQNDGDEESPDFSSTFWGTSSADLVALAVRDAEEILGAESANLQPILDSPPRFNLSVCRYFVCLGRRWQRPQ